MLRSRRLLLEAHRDRHHVRRRVVLRGERLSGGRGREEGHELVRRVAVHRAEIMAHAEREADPGAVGQGGRQGVRGGGGAVVEEARAEGVPGDVLLRAEAHRGGVLPVAGLAHVRRLFEVDVERLERRPERVLGVEEEPRHADVARHAEAELPGQRERCGDRLILQDVLVGADDVGEVCAPLRVDRDRDLAHEAEAPRLRGGVVDAEACAHADAGAAEQRGPFAVDEVGLLGEGDAGAEDGDGGADADLVGEPVRRRRVAAEDLEVHLRELEPPLPVGGPGEAAAERGVDADAERELPEAVARVDVRRGLDAAFGAGDLARHGIGGGRGGGERGDAGGGEEPLAEAESGRVEVDAGGGAVLGNGGAGAARRGGVLIRHGEAAGEDALGDETEAEADGGAHGGQFPSKKLAMSF